MQVRIMGLTVWPNDDGTLLVIRDGQEITVSPAEDLALIGFTQGEQHFLNSQFRYAVPGPVACRLPQNPPDIPDFPPAEWSGR
jgi:hypothetical protein